jgi:hypothetical protein
VNVAPALTQGGLDLVRHVVAQRHPGTEAYRLVSSCHPRAGVDLIYTGLGMMLVWCHLRTSEAAVLAVAPRPAREETP